MKRMKISRKLRKQYDKVFKYDPISANLFLLIYEMAEENGQVRTDPAELSRLMTARFKNPEAYQLPGGGVRHA